MANESGSGTLRKSDLEEVLTQIFEMADEAGATKEEMRSALDDIADLADPDTIIQKDEEGRWVVIEESAEEDDQVEDDEVEDDYEE